MKRKAYFFTCRRCGRRLDQKFEALVKPGVCQRCYGRAVDRDELERRFGPKVDANGEQRWWWKR